MRPDERDAAYLWDMLDAAQTIREITKHQALDAYLKDRTLQLAVERALEIIGEGARRVSQPLCEAHPEIPWRPIIAQRNVLAHEYGDIRQERIWAVVTRHIPELIERLEPLVPPAPGSSPA